ncbi:MAG TPA: lysylphosphatidylglycerol synthase transmembrane domain-containing protein [Roseiflexaceae bacterium]|jgi:hypothetical protein
MVKTIVRVVLTTLLIAWVASKVDFQQVGALIRTAHVGWLVLGFFVHLIGMGCAALRWQMLLRGMGIRQSFLRLARLILVGSFFNMFLPSSIGGDITKMVMLSSDPAQREIAVSSVLMDRVVGMAVVIIVGLGAALALPVVRTDPRVMTALLIICAVFAAVMAMLFNRRLLALLSRLLPGGVRARLSAPASRIYDALAMLRRHPGALLGSVGASLLLQITVCCSVYMAGHAFGIETEPLAYFALVPIGLAITALPISINGLGVQDNAFVLLFAIVGVTAAPALSLSLYVHLMRNSFGLIGGALFALSNGRSARQPSIAPEPIKGTRS